MYLQILYRKNFTFPVREIEFIIILYENIIIFYFHLHLMNNCEFEITDLNFLICIKFYYTSITRQTSISFNVYVMYFNDLHRPGVKILNLGDQRKKRHRSCGWLAWFIDISSKGRLFFMTLPMLVIVYNLCSKNSFDCCVRVNKLTDMCKLVFLRKVLQVM